MQLRSAILGLIALCCATSSVIVSSAAQSPMAGRWSWEDGRPVTVGFGDTIDNIGFKYGVPKSAVLEANGLTDKTTLFLGQQIMIPHYATVEEQRRILREMANGEIHDLQPDK